MTEDGDRPPAGVSQAAWDVWKAERRREQMIDALDHREGQISAERWADPPPEPGRAAELDEELMRLRARRRAIMVGESGE